ncbi:hypothetical protein D9619_001116 [Psilocybe cf. subviscida]|uniref:RNase H type-1 domain-containing protein n=1 Tax=Psilocybe cf. subviscida TaxID=2480587 RepID=A0A8H5F450_9AGAR|nr:hypothetical protein D9619_001116 [Psilocybe cf. subviscida]
MEHWEDFLTNASTADMWTANGYIKNPVRDAGKPRIPSLKANKTDKSAKVDTNAEKASLLATVFFPKKPERQASPTLSAQIKRVTMDPDLNWKAQETAAVSKAHKWVTLFKRLARTTGGLNGTLMRQLYRSVGLPKLTYAADLWYEPPHIKPNNKKRSGSVRVLGQLQRIQRMAAIAITGALKSTAGDVLDIHANLIPIEIYMESLRRRAYIRICTLPTNHILNRTVQIAYMNKDIIKMQLSPIQQMVSAYRDIDPDRVEKIGHSKRPVYFKPVYLTETAPTRQASITAEKEDKARFKIYTDGSGINGQVGAAATLYEGNQQEPTAIRHYHLGPTTKYTTYDAEWIGLLLAVWLITTVLEQGRIGISNISVYVDNQSVIKTLDNTRPGPAQHITDAFQTIAESTRTKGPRIKKFDIKWISAHSEVARNERVDEEAKAAAAGSTSPEDNLPEKLQQPLPYSKSALVQAAKAEAKQKWKEKWQKSDRRPRLEEIDEEFPCKTYMRVCRLLPRHQASRLIQLRTGHIPLNDYLHKRKLAQTNKCKKCRSGQRETLQHFLFECPAYRKQRVIMDRAHKDARHNLKSILKDVRYTTAVLQYIDQTGRLPKKYHQPER